jgi:uronate dehydrogenase
MVHLVERSIDTPITGFSIVYGLSNNDRAPVDNSKAQHLGYRPKDNAEQFAKEVYAEAGPLDPHDPANTCHGGPFAVVDLGSSGVALMNLSHED